MPRIRRTNKKQIAGIMERAVRFTLHHRRNKWEGEPSDRAAFDAALSLKTGVLELNLDRRSRNGRFHLPDVLTINIPRDPDGEGDDLFWYWISAELRGTE